MRARTTGDLLHLSNGKSVRFDRSILEAVEIRGIAVVVLDQPRDRIASENAFAVDPDGRVIWRVAPHDFPEGPDYYVGISESGDTARLIHYSGFVLDVDPRTGDVLSERLEK